MKVDPRQLLEHAERHIEILASDDLGERSERGTVPFVANRGQRHRFLETRAARLDPVKLISFKGRQGGNTTFELVYIAEVMLHLRGASCVFVIPEDRLPAVRRKWRAIEVSLASSPGSGFPGSVVHNDKQIEWANGSKLSWVEAGDTKVKAAKVGVGDTIDYAVFSEFGKWRMGRETMDALEPAVERAKGTISIDSTAPEVAGVGEAYLSFGSLALSGQDPTWEVFFWPWWWEETYRDPEPARAPFAEDELRLMELHGLDEFQIAWRRRQRRRYGAKFRYIYPETPRDALMPHGGGVFSEEVVARYMARGRGDWPVPMHPGGVHTLLPEVLRWDEHGARDLFLQPRWTDEGPVDDVRTGYVRIWHPPQRQESAILSSRGSGYMIGVDTSSGRGRDWQVATVINPDGCIVAAGRMRVDPMVFASYVARLGYLYAAEIHIEHEEFGALVYDYLTSVLSMEEVTRRGAHPCLAERYTGAWCGLRPKGRRSKVTAYEAAVAMLDGVIDVPDPKLWDEMLSLDPDTLEHARRAGCYDDYFYSVGHAWAEQDYMQRNRHRRDDEGQPRVAYGLRQPRRWDV